jgi:hypothetical protein
MGFADIYVESIVQANRMNPVDLERWAIASPGAPLRRCPPEGMEQRRYFPSRLLHDR